MAVLTQVEGDIRSYDVHLERNYRPVHFWPKGDYAGSDPETVRLVISVELYSNAAALELERKVLSLLADPES